MRTVGTTGVPAVQLRELVPDGDDGAQRRERDIGLRRLPQDAELGQAETRNHRRGPDVLQQQLDVPKGAVISARSSFPALIS